MPYFERATMFGSRGGNPALARRAAQFAEMQNVARYHGLLPAGQEAPTPEGFKGAFFRVVDLISRPNYAIAGFFDTLQGTGKEGEYAMERAFREMFSGVAGLQGDKETFGDVLEQAGLPEGPKLSDLVGENGLTKNFNPGTRGAVGLALDIFTDPLTYISAPVKNASVVIGVGGEVRFLNKAGLAARKAKYTQRIDEARKAFNLADDVGGDVVLQRIGESAEFAARHGDVSAALAKSEGMGLVEVATALNREIGEELVAKGGSELFEKAGWRFRPIPGVDIPVGVDQAIAKVSGMLWDGMGKFELGQAAKEFTEDSLQALDKVFNQVPFLARKNQQYYRDRSEWFMRRSAAEHVAGLEAKTLMDGVHMKLWDDRDLWRTFIRALERGGEDPELVKAWERAAKGKGVQNPEQFMAKWTGKWDSSGRHEVQAGLLDNDDFMRHQGAYWHRAVDHIDSKTWDNVRQQLSARGSGRAGIKSRGYREQRNYGFWDEFEEAMVKAGVDEKDIILNPYEVAKTRLTEHYEDMVTREFLEKTHRTMGFKQAREVRQLQKALDVLSDGGDVLTDEQAAFLEVFKDRSSTWNPLSYKTARQQELNRLLTETPEGGALQRIHEIVENLGKGLDGEAKRVAEARIQKTYKTRRKALERARIFDLQEYKEHARAEAKLMREVRGEVRTLQKGLKEVGRSAMRRGGSGYAQQLEEELAKAQQKLRDLKRRRTEAPQGRGYEVTRDELKAAQQRVDSLQGNVDKLRAGEQAPSVQMALVHQQSLLDDAVERAGELKDYIKGRPGYKKGIADDIDQAILKQTDIVDALKGHIKSFRQKFKDEMVVDMDGNTVKSLQEELDLIAAKLDDLEAQRKIIVDLQKQSRQKIRDTDKVFEDLNATLENLVDLAQYSRVSRRAAREKQRELVQQFRLRYPTSMRELKKADMDKFRMLPKNVRAAYLHDTISQIDDIVHFEAFLRKFGDEIAAVDEELAQLADTISTGKLYDQYGQEYQKISIRLSPRARDPELLKAADMEIIDAQDQLKIADTEYRERRAALEKVRTDRRSARSRGKEDTLAASPEEYERLKLEEQVAESLYNEARATRKDAKRYLGEKMKAKKDIDPMGGSKIMYLPKSIIDDLENMEDKFLQNPEVGKVLSTFDRLSNWFKLAVTRYFPSFHVRNAYSNVAASFMDIGLEALNANRARQALDVLRGADGTFKVKGGESIPYRMIRQELDALGIRVDKAMIAELTGRKQTAFDPLEKFFARGLKEEGAIETAAGIATKAYAIPGNVENHARAMHYLALRRRGFTPQDAAMQVNKFLFDYADLSPTERAVFRRLFPFWTWTRKNATRQIKNLYERPGRVATQTKIFAGDRGPSGDLLPEYMRGQMNVKVQQDDNGETWLTGIDLPIANLDILWAGGFGKTFREQIGLLTPLIKDPMELGIGKDFFSGREVHGVGQIREKLGYSMNRNLPQWAKDFFELQNVGTEEDPRWQANRLKLHIATKAMFLSRFISSRVQLDDMAREFGEGDVNAGAVAMLKIFSGLNLRGFDLESKERAMLFNRARELEDLLVDRGMMREFNKRYLPAETRDEVRQAGQRPPLF